MKLFQKITLFTTVVLGIIVAFPFFVMAQATADGRIEVHLIDINFGNDTTTGTTGISDSTAPVRAAGHFINSFGSAYGMSGMNNYQNATRYTFPGGLATETSIPVSADVFDGSATIISDTNTTPIANETVVGPITLPFNVNIFGELTNTIAISSNGFIYAESNITPGLPTDPGCCSGYIMQNQNFSDDDFMIAGVWTNLDPGDTENGRATIKTEVFGTAPNRRFVIEFNNVSTFRNYGTETFQIKLYEDAGITSSIGTGEEVIQPGILQLSSVPANFNFPAVNIVNFQDYDTIYVNQQTVPERLTAEDKRFSGGFEVQVTATDYVGQNNPSNTIPVSALGMVTQTPSSPTDYQQTSEVENIHNESSGTLISGSQGEGALVSQTLPFYFPMFGRESNRIFICSSGFIVAGPDVAELQLSDFTDLCNNSPGAVPPPAGTYGGIIPYMPTTPYKMVTTNTGAFDATNGIFYEQVSNNEVRIRFKANESNGGAPTGSISFTVAMFKDGRIETHYGPISIADSNMPSANIADIATSTQISITVTPFINFVTGNDFSSATIRFSPISAIFNDISKPGTPPVYALTNSNSATNSDNYIMFTTDTGNPGYSVPMTILQGAACSQDQGRLGNYTVYPSFLLRIPPTTVADTYQNTITFTIFDNTLPNGAAFCPPV